MQPVIEIRSRTEYGLPVDIVCRNPNCGQGSIVTQQTDVPVECGCGYVYVVRRSPEWWAVAINRALVKNAADRQRAGA